MVIRKGRLPREPRVRQLSSPDNLASGALRLRREQKMTTITGRAPHMDYRKIQDDVAIIEQKGKEVEQQGAETEQKIIQGEQELRKRVLPPEPEEPELPEKPSIFESLPARIPEPPTFSEIKEAGARVAVPVMGAVTGIRTGLEKGISRVRKRDEYEALKKKWSKSDYKKIASVS
jgi:hypothetical protein